MNKSNNSTNLRALVIGFGKMGMLHAATLRIHPDVQKVSICDKNKILLDGVKQFSDMIDVYSDLDLAFKQNRYDLCVVATPTSSHSPIIKQALKNKCHVFVEKPMTSDSFEADELANWIVSNRLQHKKLSIGHCLQFAPTFSWVKHHLDKHIIGNIQRFEASMLSSDVLKPHKGWRFRKSAKGGGVLLDLGSHLVDMIQYYFGMPKSIKAETRKIYSRFVEDSCSSDWLYSNKKGRLEISWSNPEVRKATMEIFIQGDSGSIRVLDDEINMDLSRSWHQFDRGKHTLNNTDLKNTSFFDLAGSFYSEQLLAWIKSIQNDSNPPNNLKVNQNNMLLLDYMKKSGGQALNIPLKTQSPELILS